MTNAPPDNTHNASNEDNRTAVDQSPEFVLRKNLARARLNGKELDALIARWSERGHHRIGSERVREEHRRLMGSFVKENLSRSKGPVLLEGVNPPWILEALLHAPPPTNAPGFRQKILVLQQDWNELFDGLACVDLGEVLGDPRIEWFIGEQASSDLIRWCESRIDDAPPAFVIQNPMLQRKATPSDAKKIMHTVEQLWSSNEAALIQRISRRPKRDSSWWAQRFQTTGRSENPLRVLVPVSRYTTYLQHIATDFCDTLQDRGIAARLLIEQDNSTVMSQSSILRAICDFDPHLIVSINYTRGSLGKHVPSDIPHLCWVQDAMDHLFTPEAGKAIGPRDIVVGMTKPELVQLYDYPPERTRWMPMVASRKKFSTHNEPGRFECEIAWATHQSEHPDLMRERILGDISTKHAEGFARLLREVEQRTQSTNRTNLHAEINSILDQHIFPDGVPERAYSLRTHLLNSVVLPYAERVLRHQTAQWAADIAKRRGWRLRLYGNGWEHHPTLSPYACGALEHNEALRDAYLNAAVHLHASIYQVTHQRVSECFISGGLPLCRTIRDSFSGAMMLTASSAARSLKCGSLADGSDPRSDWSVSINSTDLGPKLVDEMLRLGHCLSSEISDARMRWTQRYLDLAQTQMANPTARQSAEMLMSITDLCFSSEAQLESLIERAVEDHDWRLDRIKRANQDLPDSMTMEGFIDSSLELISSTLNNQPDREDQQRGSLPRLNPQASP